MSEIIENKSNDIKIYESLFNQIYKLLKDKEINKFIIIYLKNKNNLAHYTIINEVFREINDHDNYLSEIKQLFNEQYDKFLNTLSNYNINGTHIIEMYMSILSSHFIENKTNDCIHMSYQSCPCNRKKLNAHIDICLFCK